MRRWSASILVWVMSLVGASPVLAQVVNPNSLILASDRELEVMIVHDNAVPGATHTLGWLYYDELVARGYVDLGDLADPQDDFLIDSDDNGLPDFHEDLFNLNPDRGYIGEGTRCIPERIFFHERPDAGTLRLREPELLTGSCTSPSSYAKTGPRRWPDGEPGYPPQRPGGSVVGQRLRDATDLVDLNGDFRPGVIPGLVDAYFGDRGVFPHIPNLLEPEDPLNGHQGVGHIILMTTDDDDSVCPGSPALECLTPRLAQRGFGEAPMEGPVWDRAGVENGLPDYKASAFDPWGRLLAGRSASEAITEADRRVSMGMVQGGRELVFFLITYTEQIYGAATDTCFLPSPNEGGRLQCELWGHGDINVFFSKTALNLDLNQQVDDVIGAVDPSATWLSGEAYGRLRTVEYGNIDITESTLLEALSLQQRTPHVLMHSPASHPNVGIIAWEDINSGGDRSFNDVVFLVRGIGTQPTVTDLQGSPNPVMEGEPVMLQATVTTVEGLPITEGTVAFYVDGEFRSSEGVDSSGVATTWLTFPPGEYSVVAVYEGLDGQYDSSQSSEYWQFVEAAGDGGSPDGGGSDGGRPDAGGSDSGVDGGRADSGVPDAGAPDAGVPDAGAPDSGVPDAGAPDAGAPDAGAPDAGVPDAGTPDSGVPDAGVADAGAPDAGAPDSGVPDAGVPDAGSPDAGAPDSGVPDAGAPDSGPTPTDGGPVPPEDGGATADDAGTLPDDDAGTDAGEDSGTDAGPLPDDDAGTDAGTNGDEDAGPVEPDSSGPRDLRVTGWGCGATDAGSASVTMLALWLGLSFLRARGRRIG